MHVANIDILAPKLGKDSVFSKQNIERLAANASVTAFHEYCMRARSEDRFRRAPHVGFGCDRNSGELFCFGNVWRNHASQRKQLSFKNLESLVIYENVA